MAVVTVTGAHGRDVSLTYDTQASTALARQLAAAITAAVDTGKLTPALDTDTHGIPPSLPGGQQGEWIQTATGITVLPTGYDAVVDKAKDAVILGSGGEHESVMAGAGNFTFIAQGGSGTIAGGGGDDAVVIPKGDDGNWNVTLGDGNDTIFALGNGKLDVHLGTGDNVLQIGGSVFTTGSDSPPATAGNTTLSGALQVDFIDPLPSTQVTVTGFQQGMQQVDLGSNVSLADITDAVAQQTHGHHGKGGSSTVTLRDNTQVTFTDVAHLTAKDFTSN
jgi:hypothetical protein